MVCIRCKQEIGPRDKQGAVFGAKQVEVSGFSPSGAREYADGSTGWLHRGCFSVLQYRQLPPPDDESAA